MKFGIEIEFITNEINLLISKLAQLNIKYIYVPLAKFDNHRKVSSKEFLVIKPDSSLGKDGWEINIPPTYSFEMIEQLLDIVSESCNPELVDNAAMHIHVDTYTLSGYDLDNVYKYYYDNQERIIADAKTMGLYSGEELNRMLPENIKEVKSRKTNLNFRSVRMHKTLEHRIYKSTLDIDNVKWAVTQTLDIIEKAINK